jgi:hypothetical protein
MGNNIAKMHTAVEACISLEPFLAKQLISNLILPQPTNPKEGTAKLICIS